MLITKSPNIIDIFDFAVFMARFGPFEDIHVKLSDFRIVMDDLSKDGIFQNTPYTQMSFHNCFRFVLTRDGEFHCYNIPTFHSNAAYLIDEDGTAYQNWGKMLEQNPFIKNEDMFSTYHFYMNDYQLN